MEIRGCRGNLEGAGSEKEGSQPRMQLTYKRGQIRELKRNGSQSPNLVSVGCNQKHLEVKKPVKGILQSQLLLWAAGPPRKEVPNSRGACASELSQLREKEPGYLRIRSRQPEKHCSGSLGLKIEFSGSFF